MKFISTRHLSRAALTLLLLIFGAASSSPCIAEAGSLQIGNLVAANTADISFTFSNTSRTLSWPSDDTGWRLEAQTNSLTTWLGVNWVTISNSSTTDQISISVNSAENSVFFRLAYP